MAARERSGGMGRGAVARVLVAGAVGLATAAVPAYAQHEGHSPYAGTGSAEVKTLTAEEAASLREGAGMGLARAAELNGYPGPRHVLDLADSLRLSTEQRERTRAIFEAMAGRARELGERVIRAEIELDSAFAAGAAPADLEARVAEIARLQGTLRWTHLQAHLEMVELLSRHQRHEYDRLRGYGAGHARGHGH